MPVTAKLSKTFYDRLGEDIANELVEWFNLVDATYKSDLREMNEANFVKFDAKLEQRLAEFRAQFGSELRAEMNAGFTKLDARITALEVVIANAIGNTRAEIGGTRAEMIKWSFVFWAGSVAANFFLVRALLDR